MPNKSQIRRLYTIAHAHNWSHSGVRELIKMNYGIDSSRDLTPEQYDKVCMFLETTAAADVVTMGRDPNTIDMFGA